MQRPLHPCAVGVVVAFDVVERRLADHTVESYARDLAALARYAAGVHKKPEALDRRGLEAFVRRLIKQQSPSAIRTAIHRMMHRPDSTPLLSSITVPTLVITGEEDTLIPVDDSRAMAKAIGMRRLIRIRKLAISVRIGGIVQRSPCACAPTRRPMKRQPKANISHTPRNKAIASRNGSRGRPDR